MEVFNHSSSKFASLTPWRSINLVRGQELDAIGVLRFLGNWDGSLQMKISSLWKRVFDKTKKFRVVKYSSWKNSIVLSVRSLSFETALRIAEIRKAQKTREQITTTLSCMYTRPPISAGVKVNNYRGRMIVLSRNTLTLVTIRVEWEHTFEENFTYSIGRARAWSVVLASRGCACVCLCSCGANITELEERPQRVRSIS